MRRWVMFGLMVMFMGCNDKSVADPVDPLADTTMLTIPVKDMTFTARASGPEDGELVLLLHGFPESSYEWRYQLGALAAAGYRAVALDQRGYSIGARPTDVEEYGVLLLAQDVIDIADALGAQRFHVVGHDWGGGVAWTLGRLVPERVISIVVVSTPHPDAFNEQLRDMGSCQHQASAYFDLFTGPGGVDYFMENDRARLKSVYECLSPKDVAVYLDIIGNPDGMTAALDWYRANITDRVFNTPVLGAIDVPTLYVWGDQDPVFCRDTAELTAKFVTGPYRFEIVPGVAHFVPECGAEQFNRLLLEHLRGV